MGMVYKIWKRRIWVVLLFLCAALPSMTQAAETTLKKEAARKYKIGYLEGGPFWTFSETMKATNLALEKMGWKDRVEFPNDAWFSPGWEKEEKPELQERARELMAQQDLDLVIAAGTAAAKALLKANNGKTPIVAICVADPVKAGLVTNEKDSGVDNFTTRIVPGEYRRMISMFHDVVQFKKLGLMYSDTENGRQYAHLEDVRHVAKQRGFELIEYNKLSSSEKTEECREGMRTLVQQGMDAFFITALICFDWKESDVSALLAYLAENKIPSFARDGTMHVKGGALMGFSTVDFTSRGIFTGQQVVKVLEGVKARSLPMVDDATPKISLNLAVAAQIGFDPPFDILGASDEIFQEITAPEERRVK